MKHLILFALSLFLIGFVSADSALAQTDGAVSGRVSIDGSGSAVVGAEVMALGNGTTYYAISAEDGSFRIVAPEGQYIIAARIIAEDGANAYVEYYDDADVLQDAALVSVVAGQEVSDIDFGVPDLPNIISAGGTVTITGSVTDAVSGKPVSNAAVMANEYEGVVLEVDTAFTDAGGFFTLELPNYVQRLKVWAFAPGYNLRFYEDQPSHHSASPITVDPEEPSIDGVNFELLPNSHADTGNRIVGTVRSEAGTPVDRALVVAFDAATSETRYGVSASDGIYSIVDLRGGDYYVIAIADGFIPEFYGDTYTWEDATAVEAHGTRTDVNFLIGGLNRPPIGNRKQGRYTDAATVVTGLTLRPGGEPVGMAVVQVYDAEGNFVAFDLTDRSGYFEITGLPAGSYSISSERVQYAQDTQAVEVPEADHFVHTHTRLILVNTTSTGAERDAMPHHLRLRQNYPNPFNPQTIIDYELPEAVDVDLGIFDVLGRRVATLVRGTQASGPHRVTFSASRDLAAGVYVYRLRAAGREVTRTMLLLK